MSAYKELLKKELNEIKWPVFFLIAITVLWQLYLASNFHRLPPSAVFALGWLPIFFLPIWLLWNGFQGFRTEWSQDTIYMLLSLPVAGWKLTSTKLLVLLLGYVFLVIVIAGGFTLLLRDTLPIVFGDMFARISPAWYWESGIKLGLVSMIFAAILIMISQFSYLVSKLVNRFQGMLAILIFVLTWWFVIRIGDFIKPLFAWIPLISFQGPIQMNDSVSSVSLESATLDISYLIAMFIISFGLFLFSSWLLQEQIEV